MIKNVDEIKDSADIVSIIGAYVDLKRAGVNYTGNCPFHDEKTPSFVVSPAKKIFKCFGCGQGGESVKFLIEHLALSYPEALEMVAKLSSISVDYDTTVNRDEFLQKVHRDKKKKESVLTVLNSAYAVYQKNKLRHRKNIVNLYAGKKYRLETLQAFRVCIAPNENILTDNKDLDKQILKKAGWISAAPYSTENDIHYFDFFKNRVLFPIMDIKGNVLGISARTQDPKEKKHKYLNSIESDVFEKRNILFGVPQAYKSIRERGFAYLFEGQTDVIGAHDIGVENGVATLGSAFTAAHAKKIALYTDRLVICYDGDALEKQPILEAIETALSVRLYVSVLELPAEHDPDSFARENGLEGWKTHYKDNIHDAIIWRIKKIPVSNPHQKEEALKTAALLIAKVDSDTQRDLYAKEISKLIGQTVAVLKSAIKEERNKEISKTKKLTPSQEISIQKFQTYAKYNKYYKSANGGDGYEISNFIIKPIMLIRAKDYSIRLVEIINEFNQSETVEIASDDFVALSSFRKKVEALGNNVFHGKEDDFMRVKMMVYENTPVCFPIYTMGLHKRGFYTWGNGVTTPEGGFIPVNKFGTFIYNDITYYLQSFSELKLNIESDEVSNEDDPGTYFKYVKRADTPDFNAWATQFLKVFGDNGMLAICYYLATVYRDIIFPKLKFFPHLNLFGPPGSGKTYLAWRLSSMFGLHRDPVSIPSSTLVAFSRRPAQVRNGIAWFDEYSADTDPRLIEILKNFADGIGRSLGAKTNNNTTKMTPVNSSIVISGQVLPNQDPALLTRCITLFFEPITTTAEQDAEAARLLSWEDGRLTALTAHLHTLRPLIEKNYSQSFKEIKEAIKLTSKPFNPIDRLLNSFAMMATVFDILKTELNIPIKRAKLFDFINERIKAQVESVKGADEVNGFWSLIKFLIEQGLLKDDQYIVQEVDYISIQDSKDQTKKLPFSHPRKIMFLRFDAAFGLYREHAKKQGAKRVLAATDLKYYIRISPSFAGLCKAKKFGDKPKRCWQFYADNLPIELDNTIHTVPTGDFDPTAKILFNDTPEKNTF